MSENRCFFVTNQLSAYIDQELSTREREGVELHLETCAPCRERLARLSQSREVVRSIRIGFDALRIHTWKQEWGSRRKAPRNFRLFWMVGAGAVALFTIAGLWGYAQFEKERYRYRNVFQALESIDRQVEMGKSQAVHLTIHVGESQEPDALIAELIEGLKAAILTKPRAEQMLIELEPDAYPVFRARLKRAVEIRSELLPESRMNPTRLLQVVVAIDRS